MNFSLLCKIYLIIPLLIFQEKHQSPLRRYGCSSINTSQSTKKEPLKSINELSDSYIISSTKISKHWYVPSTNLILRFRSDSLRIGNDLALGSNFTFNSFSPSCFRSRTYLLLLLLQ